MGPELSIGKPFRDGFLQQLLVDVESNNVGTSIYQLGREIAYATAKVKYNLPAEQR